MRRRTIMVTAKDIKRGAKKNAQSCPVALAVKRARLVPSSLVCVGDGTLDIQDVWCYPYKIDKWICRFDTGNKVKPISFVATS